MAKTAALAPLREFFRFPVSGEDWQSRFLIGSGLILASLFIPLIPGIFVYGYALQIMRRIIDGKSAALPEWKEWGILFVDGLRVLFIGIAFLLPAFIVACGATGLYFAGFIPLLGLAEGDTYAQSVLTFYLLTFGIMFLGFFVSMILMVVGLFPLPFATALVATQNSAFAAFRFGEWWPGLRKGAVDYLIAWLLIIGLGAVIYVGFAIGYYSIILCCLLPFFLAPASFYTIAVWAAIFGETYRENMSKKKAK